jgi:hypothetical protein
MAPTDRVHGLYDFSVENLHDVEGWCCLDLCVVYSHLLWLRRESQSRRIDRFERSCSPSFFRRELAHCSRGAKLRVLEAFENHRQKAGPLASGGIPAAKEDPRRVGYRRYSAPSKGRLRRGPGASHEKGSRLAPCFPELAAPHSMLPVAQ